MRILAGPNGPMCAKGTTLTKALVVVLTFPQ